MNEIINYQCRFCNSGLEHIFLDLGKIPSSNSFLKKEDLGKEKTYPLCVYICKKCLLVQIPEIRTPNELFFNYAYFSSFSTSWLNHAKEYVNMMIKRFNLNKTSQIIEIASNDGYLLKFFVEHNIPVLGIEPASNKYDLFFSSSQEKSALNYLNQFTSKCKVGINLEGAVKGKKIQNTELEQICKGIKQVNNNVQIIILTAPNNLHSVSQLVKEIGLEYVVPSYKTKTILDVAALIKNLDIIITPDTSIVHIASAFDKPIVTIHEKNHDSFQLFSPTSSLNKTVFSPKNNSIVGFDVEKVVEFSNELIKEIS